MLDGSTVLPASPGISRGSRTRKEMKGGNAHFIIKKIQSSFSTETCAAEYLAVFLHKCPIRMRSSESWWEFADGGRVLIKRDEATNVHVGREGTDAHDRATGPLHGLKQVLKSVFTSKGVPIGRIRKSSLELLIQHVERLLTRSLNITVCTRQYMGKA